jgi:hypothetical protein
MCEAGLVVIVAMAVVGQFGDIWLYSPYGYLSMQAPGVVFNDYRSGWHTWHAWHGPSAGWSLQNLLYLPKIGVVDESMNGKGRDDHPYAFLPWWLLLLTWGLLTAFIWRLTRRRQVPHGFPIEPSVKPQ